MPTSPLESPPRQPKEPGRAADESSNLLNMNCFRFSARWKAAPAFGVLAFFACRPAPPPGPTPSASGWLSETGFPERATWESAEFHRFGWQLPPSGTLANLLNSQDGLRVRSTSRVGWGIQESRSPFSKICEVHVYVNGSEYVPSAAGGPINIDQVIPMHLIDGLEYHRGPNGPVLAVDGCGSLLIWSQDLRTPDDPAFRGHIVGRVTSSANNPVSEIEVLKDIRSLPSEGGRYSFLGLLPGPYEVLFRTASGSVHRQEVRVYAYEETRLDVQIGGRIRPAGTAPKDW